MTDRVSNQTLLEAGLAMMRAAGKPLEKIQSKGRAMKYALGGGGTVRVRTCNDHVLVVLADSAEEGAALNIEGTDHLLIVMPEVPRQEGPILAYFVPTSVAVEAVRRTHAEWLESNPATNGNNRTWNIWFDDSAAKSGGFAQKWERYRLQVATSTPTFVNRSEAEAGSDARPLGAVIAEARSRIAKAAGVPLDAVKISVVLD